MGSLLLSGTAAFLFLVFLGKEVLAEHLRKNCKPHTTSCLAHLWVYFPFWRADGSVIFQWLRMDRGLIWWLSFDWIPGFFISFCTETCGAIECPGKIYHFIWVKEAQREKKSLTQWEIASLISQASSQQRLPRYLPCARRGLLFWSLTSEEDVLGCLMLWVAWIRVNTLSLITF